MSASAAGLKSIGRDGFGVYPAASGSAPVRLLADGSDAPLFRTLSDGLDWLEEAANVAQLPPGVEAPAIKAHAAVARGGWILPCAPQVARCRHMLQRLLSPLTMHAHVSAL